MATTLQDLQAKRKELQATNPNATMLDAKSAISPIQNAPIAGQAPAIAPVAPTPAETPMNVNQKVLADNQAKVQSEIAAGTRPEVGTKATPEQTPAIIQQAQTQTAQANKETPTAPVAPTETATTQTENKSSNPISTTSNVSNQQVVTPDSNSIYTSLRSNVPVADITKNTQAYKDAQARYNNFQKYASYDVNTLTTALSNGTILPGTSTWNDLMTDPVMGGKILQAKALTNGKGADYITTTQNVSDTIVSNSPVVSGMLADGQITAEEWATATNTPEVTAKMADVEAKKNAYDTLKAKYDDVETQVKADFPGSPFADSIIADRRKSMFKELTIAGDTYNNALGTLTQLKTDASNLFETNMKLYQDQKAVENQKAMIEYTAKVGLQSKIAEQQVADELARQAQNDPTKAIPALIAQYTEMGVPMQRSTQEIVQEAQNEIANGGTLASYLTNLQKTIQSKPEYKRIQELQAGQMTDMEKLKSTQGFELGKMGMEQDFQMKLAQAKNVTNNKWTKLDDGLYTNENGDIITADELKTAKLVDNSYLQKQVGEEGGECGVFASRGVGMSSTPGGNSKEARAKAFSETTPQVGGMAFFGGAGYDPTYGHISIVTSVNEDGTINVKDSNYNGDKKVTERTVPASTATGYYNNTPLAKGVGGEGTQPTGTFTDSDIAVLGSVAKLDKQGKATLTENGLTDRDWANFNAGLLPPTAKQKSESQVVVDRVDDILDGDWSDAVGPFLGKARVFTGGGTDRKVTELKVAALKDLLAMANLDKIKGAMSDKDIEFLRNTATYLSTDLSESEFEKTLNEIKSKYANIAGGKPTVGTTQSSTGTTTDSLGIR